MKTVKLELTKYEGTDSYDIVEAVNLENDKSQPVPVPGDFENKIRVNYVSNRLDSEILGLADGTQIEWVINGTT